MPFWEVYSEDMKKIMGVYNQKYFSEVKIGEIVKLVYASYIREGHDLIIRDSEEKNYSNSSNSLKMFFCSFDIFFGTSTTTRMY